MVGYVFRKVFHTAFVAFGVVTLVFAALRLSGDPAATMLPGDASVEATPIVHDEKPWVELFQEVVIYGVSPRVTLTPRPDYRIIVSELLVAR